MLYRPFFGYIPPSIAKKGGIFLKRRWYVTKVVYSLIGIFTYLSPAGWDWLVAKARRHQCRQHPCHWVWTG